MSSLQYGWGSYGASVNPRGPIHVLSYMHLLNFRPWASKTRALYDMFFFAKFDLQYKWDMHFFYLVSDERKVGHLQGQRVLAKRSDKSGMVWDPVQAREFAQKFRIDEATQNLDPEDQDTDGKDGEDEEPIPDGRIQ